MKLFSCVVIFLGCLLTAGAKVEYNREVLPILTAKCLACHGPDVSKQKADLRLDDPGEAYRERDGLRGVESLGEPPTRRNPVTLLAVTTIPAVLLRCWQGRV